MAGAKLVDYWRTRLSVRVLGTISGLSTSVFGALVARREILGQARTALECLPRPSGPPKAPQCACEAVRVSAGDGRSWSALILGLWLIVGGLLLASRLVARDAESILEVFRRVTCFLFAASLVGAAAMDELPGQMERHVGIGVTVLNLSMGVLLVGCSGILVSPVYYATDANFTPRVEASTPMLDDNRFSQLDEEDE